MIKFDKSKKALMILLLTISPVLLFSNDVDIEKVIQGCMKVGQKRTELKSIWQEKISYYEATKNSEIGERLDDAMANNDLKAVELYTSLYTNQIKTKNEMVKATLEWVSVGTLYMDYCSFLYSVKSVDKDSLLSELKGMKNFKDITIMMYQEKQLHIDDYNKMIKMQDKSIKALEEYYNKK